MKLASQRLGAGPELVLVHGWAMHSGVWRPWAERLAARWRVTLVDLPGHGLNREVPFELAALPEQLAAVAPPGAVWLGWSLGGQLCLRSAAALAPAGLLLLATNPRFCLGDGWPGVEPARLAQMQAGLAVDPDRVVQGFLGLIATGGDGARAAVRALKPLLAGVAATPALEAGLAALAALDLRADLAELTMPAGWLVGSDDPLVPAAAVGRAAALMPNGWVERLPGSGHLPFMTHAAGVEAALARLRAQLLGD